MDNKIIHIVCFTIPYPVDYGGVFDLYYKLKALQNIGIHIQLHCIQYGDGKPQKKLEQYCEKVYYYKRKKIFPLSFGSVPYIVASRTIPEMIERLNKDNYPILVEGIHSTGILEKINSKTKVLIRLHNVEYIYYKNLAKTTTHLFKKIYYWSESLRLKKWEKKLVTNNYAYSTVSLLDYKLYSEQLSCKHIHYIPLFIPVWKNNYHEGLGDFCLYQGNLDVEENQKAVLWLIEKVFKHLSIPLYIAGKSKGNFVKKIQDQYTFINCIENPTEEEMQTLITNAQINLLPSFNETGIKIKLLNALYNGRHCIVNKAMVQYSGLENLCIVAESQDDFAAKVNMYFAQQFTKENVESRKLILESIYDNKKNAILLQKLLLQE